MRIALQTCRPVSSGLVAELAGKHTAAAVSAAVFELFAEQFLHYCKPTYCAGLISYTAITTVFAVFANDISRQAQSYCTVFASLPRMLTLLLVSLTS